MPEVTFSQNTSKTTLTTTELPNPAVPDWFAEVALLAQLWKDSGLLDLLRKYVHVPRKRAGKYEVQDYVLLLLAYAVSSEPTVEKFYLALKPCKKPLMALWDRDETPHSSALSRFLSSIQQPSVQSLRDLVYKDLTVHGVPLECCGGLYDRTNKRHLCFDIDGNKKALRQRSLPTSTKYPPPQRRGKRACAPGHSGRKRGQVVRNRTAVMQSHTGEWLGFLSNPGNERPMEQLQPLCEQVLSYLQSRQLEPGQGCIRLDGLYGSAGILAIIRRAGLHYLTRCRNYSLLTHPQVLSCLESGQFERWQEEDSQVVREVFDVGLLDDWGGFGTRVIVTRRRQQKGSLRKIGKKKDGWIYEIFLSSYEEDSFIACDLLSLYLGRGGFEKWLGDELKEQAPERWCSYHPEGQDFWQVLNQWVWNTRIRLGLCQHEKALRRTLWSPALEEKEIQQHVEKVQAILERSDEKETKRTSSDEVKREEKVSQYGEMVVAQGHARGSNKFSGSAFTIESETVLRCPAGKKMTKHNQNYAPNGDMKLMFSSRRQDCRECELVSLCLGSNSSAKNGRRVTVTRPLLRDEEGVEQRNNAKKKNVSKKRRSPKEPGTEAVIWEDLPGSVLRREVREKLRMQMVTIKQEKREVERIDSEGKKLISRGQRAHRRLTWEERQSRNALEPSSSIWDIQIYGVSEKISLYIQALSHFPLEG